MLNVNEVLVLLVLVLKEGNAKDVGMMNVVHAFLLLVACLLQKVRVQSACSKNTRLHQSCNFYMKTRMRHRFA